MTEERASTRRAGRWGVVVAACLGVLAVGRLAAPPDGGGAAADTRAALRLYAAEAAFADAMAGRPDVFADPAASAELAATAATTMAAALRTARATAGPQGPIRRYVAAADHDALVDRAEALAALARDAAVLVTPPDDRSMAPAAVRRTVARRYAVSPVPESVERRRWLTRRQLEGQGREAQSRAARSVAGALWAARAAAVAPADVAALDEHLAALPAGTLRALAADPVMGPVLQRLR